MRANKNITRQYRILIIWVYSKLNYAKRVRHWMNGQLWRDMEAMGFIQEMDLKFGGSRKFFWWEEGCEIKETSETNATVGKPVTIQLNKDSYDKK